MERRVIPLAALLLCFLFKVPQAQSATFAFSNKCAYTVWVGTLSGAGTPPLSQTGFKLNTSVHATLYAPVGWSGRFWGRSHCTFDSTGKFKCLTGDCGTGKVECEGAAGVPPATLVEVTLGRDGGNDFYDVSLVDGYNVPVSVEARGGRGDCRPAGCRSDLDSMCPKELQVMGNGGRTVVACRSACEAFGDPKYCCRGLYGSPSACKPTNYSEIFKGACPQAYSYAYDDATSTFTCAGANYLITFCP